MVHSLGGLRFDRVGSAFIMYFAAVYRRVEDAGHDQFGIGTQDMAVVFVKCVYGTGTDSVDLAASEILDAPFAGNAVYGLKMMPVMHLKLRSCIYGRNVKRKTHAVSLEQETHTVPTLRIDTAFRVFLLVNVANNHHVSSSCCFELAAEDLADGGTEDLQSLCQIALVNCQWGETLDDFIVRSAGFNNQSVGKAFFHDLRGYAG